MSVIPPSTGLAPAGGGREVLVSAHSAPPVRPRDAGFILGLLAGEGHFGGDGRQPQVTLRMHTRHAGTFDRLVTLLPGGRLYGPYHHAGRSYFQWMSRGRHLTEVLAPLILEHADLLDDHVWGRFAAMCERYGVARRPPGPAV
jgi:hypothetical protein